MREPRRRRLGPRFAVLVVLVVLVASAAQASDDGAPVEDDDTADVQAQATTDEASAATTHVRVRGPKGVRLTSTTVLGRDDQERAPARTAEDVLRQVPGFTLVQHGSEGKSMQFLLRGFDAIHGADLEVRVDGVPLNEGSHVHGLGYIDLGVVLPEVIESVEVRKGPFALQQGPFAMAGSASFRLGLPDTQRGCQVGLTVGSTLRRRGVATCAPWSDDKALRGAFIAVAGLQDKGFGTHRSIDRATGLFRVPLLRDDDVGHLDLLASLDVARFDLPGVVRADDVAAGRISFHGTYDDAGAGLTARSLVALRHRWRAKQQSVTSVAHVDLRHLSLVENDTGFFLDGEHGDRRKQQQRALRMSLDSEYRTQLWSWLAVTAGTGVVTHAFSQRQLHLDMDERVLDAARRFNGQETFAHVRAGASWRPLASVQVDGGLRADIDWVQADDLLDTDPTQSGFAAALSPRLAASWTPLSWWQVTAAYGRGLRPPDARAFVDDAVDSDVISSGFVNVLSSSSTSFTTSDAFEVGTRLLFSPWLVASTSMFATFLSQETVYDHTAGTTLALQGTRRVGAEAEVHGHPFRWLRLAADVAAVDARFVDSGEPVPYVPWLQGSTQAQLRWNDSQGSVRLRALAPRALPFGATSSPMLVVDATASTQVDFVRFGMEVSNLLNADVAESELMFSSRWRDEHGALPARHVVAGSPLQLRATVSADF